MKTENYPNRRTTYRFNMNIWGKIYIEKNDRKLEQDIHIINISYDGFQAVFADNDFLLDFLETIDNHDLTIKTGFEYLGKYYEFFHEIFWVRLFDIAERNYYILTTLRFRDREKFDKDLLDILYLIDMQEIYIGEKNEEKNA